MTIRHHLTGEELLEYSVHSSHIESSGERSFSAWFNGYILGEEPTESEAWELAQEHYDNHKIDSARNI